MNKKNTMHFRALFWVCLPLVLGVLFAYLSTEAFARSQPEATTQATLQWTDDFDDYPAGDTYTTGFPSNWYHSGLKDMFVYTDTFKSAPNSLKGHGITGQCGSSAAYRAIGGYAPIEIVVYVRNGEPQSPPLTGCNPFYGGLELSTAPSYQGEHRGLLSFAYEEVNGTPQYRIYGGAWEANDPAPRLYLRDYALDTWYKVKIRYELISANTARLTYWIDDQLEGQHDVPTKPHEANLAYLGLWVGEWVAWFDDVEVYASDTAPSTIDLRLTKDVNSAVVEPGTSFVYHLTVSNQGTEQATGVIVTDSLPDGVTFQAAAPAGANCQESGGTVTCNLGTLNPGETQAIDLTVVAPNADITIHNTASASHDGEDLNPNDDTDSVSVIVGETQKGYLPLLRRP